VASFGSLDEEDDDDDDLDELQENIGDIGDVIADGQDIKSLVAHQATNLDLLPSPETVWRLPPARLSVAVDSNSQIGNRDSMEDTMVVSSDIGNGWQTAFYGVYDGHSGIRAAQLAMEQLHREVATEKPPSAGKGPTPQAREKASSATFDKGMRAALQRGYERCDRAFLDAAVRGRESAEAFVKGIYEQEVEKKEWLCGSTSVTVALHGSVMYVAWVGDSLAILSRGGVPVELTPGHKPHREDECERITKAGGWVSGSVEKGGRVNGILAVSRALGDIEYKRRATLPPSLPRSGPPLLSAC
jgi:serine/threonine protein phosphatase PrpC